MGKYTDDEIRNMGKITCKIAGDYLGISPIAVSYGLQQEKLPIGFAIQNKPYSDSWSYTIVPERLIAYNHGKISEVQVNKRFSLIKKAILRSNTSICHSCLRKKSLIIAL